MTRKLHVGQFDRQHSRQVKSSVRPPERGIKFPLSPSRITSFWRKFHDYAHHRIMRSFAYSRITAAPVSPATFRVDGCQAYSSSNPAACLHDPYRFPSSCKQSLDPANDVSSMHRTRVRRDLDDFGIVATRKCNDGCVGVILARVVAPRDAGLRRNGLAKHIRQRPD